MYVKRLISILAIVAAFLLPGCQKQINKQDGLAEKQKSLLRQIGFDLKSISLESNSAISKAGDAIVFNSVEEAKAFFRPTITDRNVLHKGNIHKPIKIHRIKDVLLFVKKNALQINQSNNNEIAALAAKTDDPYNEEDLGSGSSDGTADMNSWTLWSGYHLSFNYHKNAAGHISVDGVSSNLIGFTLGVSWTQSNTQSFINYPNSALIHFDVMGYQHYNIIVEGVGTVFTQVVHLSGIYNTNTGAYDLTVH